MNKKKKIINPVEVEHLIIRKDDFMAEFILDGLTVNIKRGGSQTDVPIQIEISDIGKFKPPERMELRRHKLTGAILLRIWKSEDEYKRTMKEDDKTRKFVDIPDYTEILGTWERKDWEATNYEAVRLFKKRLNKK